MRHQAVYLKVKDLGEVWLGKTSESTDGITEISLAPSDASTLTSLAPFDAVIEDESGLGIVNPFDGYRTETLTFKTGTLLGFQASASWNQGDAWSAALRYAGEFGDVRLAGGIGYRRDELSPDFGAEGKQDTFAGSASIMHTPSGLFLDGAYSESEGVQQIRWNGDTIGLDLDGTKLKLMAGRAGFSKSISAHGLTTIYGEVGQLKVEGMDAKPLFYGLGLSQDITGAAATLYGSWRHYDLDDPDADKANTFLAGVKVRF